MMLALPNLAELLSLRLVEEKLLERGIAVWSATCDQVNDGAIT